MLPFQKALLLDEELPFSVNKMVILLNFYFLDGRLKI